MRRRTGFLALLFGGLAASSWLVYRHGGDGRRGRRTQRIASIVDPALRRADREADADATRERDRVAALLNANETGYRASWGLRRVA